MSKTLESSMVLYLPLYEADAGSFISRDARGHLCTVNGAVWTPLGRSFDGVDDYIQIQHTTALQFSATDAFSIGVWFKRSANTAALQTVIAKQNDYHLRCNSDGSGFNWGVRKGDNSDSIKVIFPGTIALDTWYHTVGTHDTDQTIKLYVQGEYIGANTGVGLWNGGQPFRVGSASWGVAELLKGYVGEVYIYNHALTPQEIQRNYLATKWRYQ